MDEIISRKDAKARGLKRYFTGNPCPKGHVCGRFVSNCACVECGLIRSIIWDNSHREHIKEYDAKRYAKNPEKGKAYSRNYKAINREQVREYFRNRQEQYPHLHAAKEAKRRALKLKATPKWFNNILVQDIYQLAKEMELATAAAGHPIEYHVDHVIPLQSKLVCGLHVHTNLQILTALENHIKSNTFNTMS